MQTNHAGDITITSDRAGRTRQAYFISAYLLGVAMAEMVTVLVQPIAGISLHAVVLVALIAHCSLTDEPGTRRLLLPLTLAPLTRILSVSMPLTILPEVYWYPVIYFPLAAATWVVVWQIGLTPAQVGLTVRQPLIQVLVVPVGALFGLVEYYILGPAPLVGSLAVAPLAFGSLIFVGTTGFVEEWIFRGVLQRVMSDRFGWAGLVYTSLLFAVLHMGFLSVADLGFVFAVALFFAWVVHRTGSLLGVTLAHGLTNVLLYVVLPNLLA